MATLQQQVQQHLQNTGISLRELARRSGISHQAIGKILRGGEYKNDTADALRIAIKPKTLDATVEKLAAQCIDSDMTHVRDTDLECAKYRRVMALEAELDAWQLKCGKERDKSERLQNELRHAETLAQAYSKDLQIMTASWKAVSVERDNLERNLSQRERQLTDEQKLADKLVACQKQAELNRAAAEMEKSNLEYMLHKAQAERTAAVLLLVSFVAVTLGVLV